MFPYSSASINMSSTTYFIYCIQEAQDIIIFKEYKQLFLKWTSEGQGILLSKANTLWKKDMVPQKYRK